MTAEQCACRQAERENRVRLLEGLLREARDGITDKPWDDPSHLHKRISEALGLPISYKDWNYDA